jgi:hypothetical protein
LFHPSIGPSFSYPTNILILETPTDKPIFMQPTHSFFLVLPTSRPTPMLSNHIPIRGLHLCLINCLYTRSPHDDLDIRFLPCDLIRFWLSCLGPFVACPQTLSIVSVLDGYSRETLIIKQLFLYKVSWAKIVYLDRREENACTNN